MSISNSYSNNNTLTTSPESINQPNFINTAFNYSVQTVASSKNISDPNATLVTPQEMYALATFSILEGNGDLTDTASQLQVANVLDVRTKAPNWVNEFGSGITDQLFAPGQFEVSPKYGLDRGDFDSLNEAAQALADAKPSLSQPRAKQLIINFMKAAEDPQQYQAAGDSIGDATGFRGVNGRNSFASESPYDPPNAGDLQSSSIKVNWPNGNNPFY